MALQGETKLSGAVIQAAIAVHRELGPGLDERNYEAALGIQLLALGIPHATQWPLPLRYKGVALDCGYRIDVLVADRLVVECKAVEAIHPVHEAQLLTYLQLSQRETGLLINFDVPVLKDGLRRKLLSAGHRTARVAKAAGAGVALGETRRWNDPLTGEIVAAAIDVHRELGPGLLRSAYEECLCYELSQRSIAFTRQQPLHVRFLDRELPAEVEVPLLVAGEVPVACLSVAQLTQLHTARLRSLLKQGQWERGLILNFNATTLLDGLRRVGVAR